MTTTYTAVFEESEGWITAWVEELPGAISQERTIEEARESLREVIGLILESRRAHANEGHPHILRREPITV
jgi:predicted RNase H-like HicB family nuclease